MSEQTQVSGIEELQAMLDSDFESTGEQAPVEETQAPVEEEAPVVEEAPAGQPEAPQPEAEYVPSFGYKVKDEERVFDERLHGSVKTREDEEYVRDLYTKADGLEAYKAKYETQGAKLAEMEETMYGMHDQADVSKSFYDGLVGNRDAGNHRKVMDAIGFTDDEVMSYALELARERELPEDERIAVQAQRDSVNRNESIAAEQQYQSDMLEHQRNELIGLQEQALVHQQTATINHHISTDHQALSAKMSEAGLNFFDEVVTYGAEQLRQTNTVPQDLSAVVNAVASRFGFMNNISGAAGHATQDLPIIPTVQASNKTQIAQPIKTIEQLQKELESITGSNASY